MKSYLLFNNIKTHKNYWWTIFYKLATIRVTVRMSAVTSRQSLITTAFGNCFRMTHESLISHPCMGMANESLASHPKAINEYGLRHNNCFTDTLSGVAFLKSGPDDVLDDAWIWIGSVVASMTVGRVSLHAIIGLDVIRNPIWRSKYGEGPRQAETGRNELSK